PVSKTQRAVGLRSAATTAERKARAVSRSTALRTSGRLSRTTATPPASEKSTPFDIRDLSSSAAFRSQAYVRSARKSRADERAQSSPRVRASSPDARSLAQVDPSLPLLELWPALRPPRDRSPRGARAPPGYGLSTSAMLCPKG